MDHGFLLLAIVAVALVVLFLALRLGDVKAVETKVEAVAEQVKSIKENDLVHVHEDTQAIKSEVSLLRNAIFNKTADLVLAVVNQLRASECTEISCPYLAAEKKKEQEEPTQPI